MQEISDLIRSRRLELGLTFEQVGQHVGVGKSTVRKWETGQIKNMGRDKVALLAEILQIPPSSLIPSSWTEEMQLRPDEVRLITLYRNAEDVARNIAVETLENHQKKDTTSKMA